MTDPLLSAIVALVLALVWRVHHPGVSFWSWLLAKVGKWLTPPAPPVLAKRDAPKRANAK